MNDQPDPVHLLGLEQVTYQQIDGLRRHAFASMFGGVDLVREFVLVQIIDGLKEFDVSQELIVRGDDDQHAFVFAPEAGVLELFVEGRLSENAAWEEVAPITEFLQPTPQFADYAALRRHQPTTHLTGELSTNKKSLAG